MGPNPQHYVAPAAPADPPKRKREPVAWCWCYCCKRRLELYAVKPGSFREEGPFSCCGRTWGRGEAQPPALHDGLAARVEVLEGLVSEATSALYRWQGRRPKGLKGLIARLEVFRRG